VTVLAADIAYEV